MATGTTEFIDNTTADVFIPEIWSMEAIVSRENTLVYAPLVDRRYESGLTFGDTIHVPSVGDLTVRTKSTNTAISYETVTETNKDITIATHEYVAIAVEDITKIQTNRDQMALYAGKLGYALGLAVDDVLAGLPDDVTNTVGSFGVDLTDEDVLRAIQYLDDANVPMSERNMTVSPAQANAFLLLDRWIHNDYQMLHGNLQTTDAAKAYVTSFLGMAIYKSVNVEGTNAAGHDNAMFHKEAFALVMQQDPKAYHQFDIDFLVDKVAMTQLYGTAQMRDDHAVLLKGS